MSNTNRTKKHKLLLVDDESEIRAALRRLFHFESYEVLTAQDAADGLQLLAVHDIDVVICDERMPGVQGSELLRTIRNRWPDTVRIMLTGNANLEVVLRAINEGEAYRFITKPWDDADLLLAVQQGLEKLDLIRENEELAEQVRRNNETLGKLEEQFPGITKLDFDKQGAYILSRK